MHGLELKGGDLMRTVKCSAVVDRRSSVKKALIVMSRDAIGLCHGGPHRRMLRFGPRPGSRAQTGTGRFSCGFHDLFELIWLSDRGMVRQAMILRFFKKDPRQIEGRQLHEAIVHCHKRWRRDRDLLSPQQEQNFLRELQKARNALTAETANPGEANKRLVAAYERCFQFPEQSDWVESIFVALVIAMAVRAFFLQPFKIPTGSMQPTLNGITVHARQPHEQNSWYPWVAPVLFGQKVVHLIARSDGELEFRMIKQKRLLSSEAIELRIGLDRHVVPLEHRVFINDVLGDSRPGSEPLLQRHQSFKRGETILDCVRQTGDYLFVDRFTYNFRKPRRGEVFVFETHDLDVSQPGEFFIKRIAGVPGDKLQIKDPDLHVNGEKIHEPIGFVRVMSEKNGYRGYTSRLPGMKHLNNPEAPFSCGEKDYFALGDNSFASQDSRMWGPVPHKNIVGRGFFVHWPFTRHFGRME